MMRYLRWSESPVECFFWSDSITGTCFYIPVKNFQANFWFLVEDDEFQGKPTFFLLRTRFGITHDITSLIVDKNGIDYPVGVSLYTNNKMFTAGYHEVFNEGIREVYGVYNLILE